MGVIHINSIKLLIKKEICVSFVCPLEASSQHTTLISSSTIDQSKRWFCWIHIFHFEELEDLWHQRKSKLLNYSKYEIYKKSSMEVMLACLLCWLSTPVLQKHTNSDSHRTVIPLTIWTAHRFLYKTNLTPFCGCMYNLPQLSITVVAHPYLISSKGDCCCCCCWPEMVALHVAGHHRQIHYCGS